MKPSGQAAPKPAPRAAPKPASRPALSPEDVERQQAARSRSRQATAGREAAFLARLEEEREQVMRSDAHFTCKAPVCNSLHGVRELCCDQQVVQELKKKAEASKKRSDEALATSSKERKALLEKQVAAHWHLGRHSLRSNLIHMICDSKGWKAVQQAAWASLGTSGRAAAEPPKAKAKPSKASQTSSKAAEGPSQQQLQQQASYWASRPLRADCHLLQLARQLI